MKFLGIRLYLHYLLVAVRVFDIKFILNPFGHENRRKCIYSLLKNKVDKLLL